MSNDDKFNRPEDERVVEMEYVGMDRDDSKFIDIIMSDVVDGVGISFDDIAGLGAAKQVRSREERSDELGMRQLRS